MPIDFVRIKPTGPERIDTTIANGQSLASPVELDGQWFSAVRLPNSAGWTTANITFMASLDGGKTYGDVYMDGQEYTITVPAGRVNASVFPVEPRWFKSVTHIIVRSGTAATPVNQGGVRALQIGRMP